MSELEILSGRLARMERNYLRVRRCILIVPLLVISSLMLMGQDAPERILTPNRFPLTSSVQADRVTETSIRTRELILVDAAGRDRASLVTDTSGSVFLVIFDANSRPRVDLSVTSIGPALKFYDPTGNTRTVIGSTSLVGSRVARGGIVERQPPSSVVLFDRDGNLLWRAP
jgi:hypothetical protein